MRLCILLLVFLLSTGAGQDCVSTGGSEGAGCFVSDLCRTHITREYQDDCERSHQVASRLPLPDGVSRCPVEFFFTPGLCPGDEGSGAGPPAPPDQDVDIHLYSLNWKYFAIDFSWHNEGSARTKIVIKQDRSLLDCVCLSSSITSLRYEEEFLDLERTGSILEVDIYSSEDISIVEDFRKITKTLSWPNSCLDINHTASTCALPSYAPPSNVSMCKRVDASHSASLHISWDYTAVQPQPHPSVFYVRVYTPPSIDSIAILVTNNTQSLELRQLDEQLLNNSLAVDVTPYHHCSGLANGSSRNHLGCGRHAKLSLESGVPDCSSVITSAALTDMVTSSTTVSVTTQSSPTLVGRNIGATSRTVITAICTVFGMALVGLLILLILIFVHFRTRKHKTCEKEPVFLPFDSEHSVFVAYVPSDSAETDIQTHVVAPLAEYFPVTTSARKVRGDLVEWIEVQERKASVVLFVITEDFLQEWKGVLCKSHFMEAMRRLVSGSVARGQLEDKYAIAVLEEGSRHYIPENGYLRNLNVYVLGEGSSQLHDLYNFVTKSKKFQHREASGSSLGSSLARSECTISADLDLDMCVPGHQQDLGLAQLEKILSPQVDQESCSNNY